MDHISEVGLDEENKQASKSDKTCRPYTYLKFYAQYTPLVGLSRVGGVNASVCSRDPVYNFLYC